MHSRTIRPDAAHIQLRRPQHLVGLTLLALALAAACQSEGTGPKISSSPASIRGWLVPSADTDQTIIHLTQTDSTQNPHQVRTFEQTYISVEGAPFASGGIGGNGSFIILDVPPGDVTINVQPPEGADAQLFLKGVPPNADVLLPGLKLNGSEVIPVDPSKIVVRIPADVPASRPAPAYVMVGQHRIQALEVPIKDMLDRRDFPEPR